MTRGLTRLAEIAYRRRGRMVLAWIVSAVVIIGVGSSLAGEFEADYNTLANLAEREDIFALWRLFRPRGLCRLEG